MSKLEELIKEYCPNGVEYVHIGSVVDYEQPSKYLVKKADYNDEYKTPVLTAGQTFVLGYTNETDGIYYATKESPVIIFDDFTGAFKWVDFPFKAKSSAMKILTANEDKVMLRYIFHVMGNINFSSTEHKRLWIGMYSELQIPLPALPVQREIVRVLDSFTLYSAELTAELTARRKQYEFYRDELLKIKNGKTQTISIDELCGMVTDFTAAGSFADIAKNVVYRNSPDYAQLVRTMDIKSNFTKGESVYVDENAFKYLWRVNFDQDCIILPNIGVNCGEVYYVEKGSLPYKNNVLGPNAIMLKDIKCNVRYLYHLLLLDKFQKDLRKIITPGGQTKFNKTELKKLKVDIPSFEIQERIVNVLDNFDKICSDLKIGLPAEIEKRQQQYEYYRDKLLTFNYDSATIFTDRQTDRQTDRAD